MNRDIINCTALILTTGLSLVLSILLFTSVSENRLSWLLLMGIAVALELGKLISINDRSKLLAGLLIVVSVFGSAGGLSRAMTVSEQQFSRVDDQRQSLLAEIRQNNQAIDRYLALDQIKADAQPLQKRNAVLRQQLADLPQSEVSELGSLIQILADFLRLTVEWVKASVILLLACLLDALMVNFVRSGLLDRIISPDDGDDPEKNIVNDSTDVNRVVMSKPETMLHKSPSANVESLADSYPAFRRMMLNRKSEGQGVLTQRACVREFGIRERLVRRYFQRLVSENIIFKNKKRQYVFYTETAFLHATRKAAFTYPEN